MIPTQSVADCNFEIGYTFSCITYKLKHNKNQLIISHRALQKLHRIKYAWRLWNAVCVRNKHIRNTHYNHSGRIDWEKLQHKMKCFSNEPEELRVESDEIKKWIQTCAIHTWTISVIDIHTPPQLLQQLSGSS